MLLYDWSRNFWLAPAPEPPCEGRPAPAPAKNGSSGSGFATLIFSMTISVQEKLEEFGVSTACLAGLTSDGAAVMVATGRLLDTSHQLCLGNLSFLFINV